MLVAAAAWGAIYYAAYTVRSQVLGRTIWRGATDRPAVALTFDDGPGPDTPALLDVLREHDVKATFFLIGRRAVQRPEIARRIVAEGHEIGNHSQTHRILLFCSPRRVRYEIFRAQMMISAVTGVKPRIVRPPCGVRSPSYFRAVEKSGLKTIQWSVAGFDWKKRAPQEIAAAVLAEAVPGSIILLHDGDSAGKADRRATVEAVPLILDGLRKKQLSVVPLNELCRNYEEKPFPAGLSKQSV